jgi:hypothetical protein
MLRSTLATLQNRREIARAAELLAVLRAAHIQKLARKNFALFKANPRHPSLRLQKKKGVYTAEIGRRYRPLAREGAVVIITGSRSTPTRSTISSSSESLKR